MDFFVTTPDIKDKTSILQLFTRFKDIAKDRAGFCYYKYPLAGGIDNYLPSITILDREYGMAIFDSYEYTLDNIDNIVLNTWIVEGNEIDSPLLKLDDYRFSLLPKYEKYRELRGNKIQLVSYVILPIINKSDFIEKFPLIQTEHILFSNEYLTKEYESFWKQSQPLSDDEWSIFVSISQGANNLTNYKPSSLKKANKTMGEAIEKLSTLISLLDYDQHAAAIQIPDGPQRIRGLAGTGKTIILAMKAAYFHQRYPKQKVLYTFNTQSLYNQIRNLITRFYRQNEDKDPNWDNLLILHAWGGTSKEGVYSRTCYRNDLEPISFGSVRYIKDPFAEVCERLLENKLAEEFDFVLMDEAQDFPPSFYKLIYNITKDPKRIIWAYDELQNLGSDHEIQDTGVFGYNEKGDRRVDFSKGSYDNDLEMDFVLKKSYRNPLEVLLVAHGIGLAIYNTEGPLQMIDNKDIWTSIGYIVERGDLKKGQKTIISRPIENSPNPLQQCYEGKQPSITYNAFVEREEEILWIAESIRNDIFIELVPPHEIIVISLNPKHFKDNCFPLQKELFNHNISSIIPGITEARDKFAEKDYVTLSTVFRAKGNEASVVYVMNFDYLYDYVAEITARNMAFTSLTRAKGWCRISGVGESMERATKEIQMILDNIPRYIFRFPDMNRIRRLSSEEYARRALEQQKANKLINELLQRDEKILQSLTEEQKRMLKERLGL